MRLIRFSLAPLALLLGALPCLASPPPPAIAYDFVYVDAFQSDYDLRECYVFGVNNNGLACGFATDLPTYSGFRWATSADKTRIPVTYPRGVNDLGRIVGQNRVFDVATGVTTTIPQVPGAPALPMALAINERDVVVGYAETCICSNSDRVLQIPFIWDAAGGVRTIAVAGAKELVAVNNGNVAVGNIRGGSPDAFVYDIATGRTIRLSAFLPVVPYPATVAAGINDRGVVTGRTRSADAASDHGFVWTEAAGATLLPHLLGNAQLDVWPWAINDDAQVVGMAEVAQHIWHAFVWDAANGIRDLNTLVTPPDGFILDRALTINDRGWIAGDGHFGPDWSSSQAFLLIPRGNTPLDVPHSGAAGGLDVQLSPNPSRAGATIAYTLPGAATARIAIFDVRGRRVAEFVEPERAAGVHQVRWDGTDRAGHAVPAGAYLIRVESGGKIAMSRMAILR